MRTIQNISMWENLHKLKEEYAALELEKVVDYEKFCMISIIWHSTKIEGCSLTETETRVLLEDGITAAGKPLTDHLMVKDHYEAFLFIKKEAVRKRPFSVNFVREVNAQVMKHTGGIVRTATGDFDSSKGGLRLLQVYVDKKYFPDAKKIPKLLEEFCRTVDEKIATAQGDDITKLAADAHYNFVNIHPFIDGNGRTARLLMNYILLYHQEPLLKIFTEDRTPYIDALNETEAKSDLNIFRTFIVDQYCKFLQAEIDKHKQLNKGFLLMF